MSSQARGLRRTARQAETRRDRWYLTSNSINVSLMTTTTPVRSSDWRPCRDQTRQAMSGELHYHLAHVHVHVLPYWQKKTTFIIAQSPVRGLEHAQVQSETFSIA